MSRAKRAGSRQVTNQILGSYPDPTPSQKIARIVSTRGGNLYEVEYPDAEKNELTRAMCRMPQKFKGRVWVKCGDYLLIEPEGNISDAVTVLYPDDIKYLQEARLWPANFATLKILSSADTAKDGGGATAQSCPSASSENTATTKADPVTVPSSGADHSEKDNDDAEDEDGGDDDDDDDDELFRNPNHVGVQDYGDDDEDEEDDEEEDDQEGDKKSSIKDRNAETSTLSPPSIHGAKS